MPAQLLAAVRTFLACTAVSLYVFIVSPPALLWAYITKRPNILYSAGDIGIRLGFALAGIKVRLEGEQHLLPGAVFAANHSSNIDSPALYHALARLFPRMRVLYKAELRRLPLLVWVWDAAGWIPLERANKGQSWPAIDRAVAALRDGNAFFIFPEGTRSRTGELLPFKKGGFVMAIKAQAPVVPVAVLGGRAAMRKGSALIWPTTVTVAFLPPVPTIGMEVEDRSQVVAVVRSAIQARLDQHRTVALPERVHSVDSPNPG